jgi:MFS family permease
MIGRAELAPLRHAPYRYFLGHRFAAMLANAMAPIALAFAVLDLEHSPSALGTVLAARSIPMIVLMLYGGVIADRFPRHVVLVVANAAGFLSQGLAATLMLTGNADIWSLAAIEAVNGAAAAFTLPAMVGLVPHLVPSGQLQQANALNGLARNVTTIGGASIGGAVVGFAGPGWGLASASLLLGLAGLLVSRVAVPPIPASERQSVIRELREGWHEFVSHRWLWLVVLAFGGLLAILEAVWFTLGPVVADETFGRMAWGLILASNSVGVVVGLTVQLRLRTRRLLLAGMIGIAIEAPMLFVLGVHPSAVPLAVAAFVAGIGSSLFAIGWETSLQQHIPHDKLSRVAAYDALGSFVAMPIGQLAAGPLAAVFGVREVIMVGAVAYAAIAVATLLDRSVRTLRRTDPLSAAGADREPVEIQHLAGGEDQGGHQHGGHR